MIDKSLIQQLRKQTGYPLGQCKQALEKTNNVYDNAMEYLKSLTLNKKYGAPIPITENSDANGAIYSYIHHNRKIGVMLQMRCDTDFTAKTKQFEQLCEDIALHIAVNNPNYIKPSQYTTVHGPQLDIEHNILYEKLKLQNKPENMIHTIVNNMLQKKINDLCLMTQKFFKDQKVTISDLCRDLSNKTNENIFVERFIMFQLGK